MVIRVIDGDTIVVSPNERVRLIGVDSPETVHPNKAVQCFGKDAKEYTRSMVERRSIRLVLDEANAARHHKDRYGRTLAYVYFDDGTMLNASSSAEDTPTPILDSRFVTLQNFARWNAALGVKSSVFGRAVR